MGSKYRRSTIPGVGDLDFGREVQTFKCVSKAISVFTNANSKMPRENCSIEPSEIRLERPNGEGKLNLDESSDTQSLNTQTATRMIDWALGLAFDEDSDDNENELIEMAFMKLGDYEASVNQSTSWIRSIPLFLDIEIKKKNSPINPEVQLAIWAAAGLNKKRRHGWDTSLPIPAIAINAHTWEFYIFFERGEDLVSLFYPVKYLSEWLTNSRS